MSRPQQTLLSRLGFNDEDSKKPEHDKIVSWMREEIDGLLLHLFPPHIPDLDQLRGMAFGAGVNQERILEAQIKTTEEQLAKYEQQPLTPLERAHGTRSQDITNTTQKLEQLRLDLEDCQTWHLLGDPQPAVERITIRSKQREKTLVADRTKIVVGFLDLQVVADVPAELSVRTKKYPAGHQSGIPIKPVWSWSREPRCLNFEIKTSISNLGELLRQINVYREYQAGQYYVVCPTEAFVEELKQERIGFIKAPAAFAPRSQKGQMDLWK